MAKPATSPAASSKSTRKAPKGKPAPVAVEATEAPVTVEAAPVLDAAPVEAPTEPAPVEAEPVAVVAEPAPVEVTEAPAPASIDAARSNIAAAYLSGGIPAAWAALAAAGLSEDDAAVLGGEIRALDAPAPVEAEPVPVPVPAPVEAAPAEPAPAPVRWRVTYAGQTVEVRADARPTDALDPLVAASGAAFDPALLTVTDLDAPAAVEAPAEPPAPVVEAAPVATSTPAPAPTPAPASPRIVNEVNLDARDRIKATRAAVARAGLAYGETWFEDGKILYPDGTAAARRMLAEVTSLPLASTALAKLAARVAGEARRDVSVTDVTEITMNEAGALVIPGVSAPVVPEVGAWQTLASRCGIVLTEPFMRARDLANPAPVVAGLAGTFNAWQGCHKAERPADAKPRTGVVGLRDVDGITRMFRFVSERYAKDIGIDVIARLIAEVCEADGIDPFAAIAYDGTRVQIDLTFPTSVDPGDFGVGELWKIQARIRSADDGSGGVGLALGLHFARCRNFSQSMTETTLLSARHLGDSAVIAANLRAALREAHVRVQPLIAAWGYAKSDNLIDHLPANSPVKGAGVSGGVPIEEAIPGFFRAILATREAVPVLSSRATPKLVEAWKADDGPGGPSSGIITRAGVVNAMTRYAHTEADPWDRAGIERLASAYLDPTRQIGWLPEKSRAKG